MSTFLHTVLIQMHHVLSEKTGQQAMLADKTLVPGLAETLANIVATTPELEESQESVASQGSTGKRKSMSVPVVCACACGGGGGGGDCKVIWQDVYQARYKHEKHKISEIFAKMMMDMIVFKTDIIVTTIECSCFAFVIFIV